MGTPGADGFDALKAQAVAARTYALERIELHAADAFDLSRGRARIRSTRGSKAERNSASSAVPRPAGLVLRRRGRARQGVLQRVLRRTHVGHPSRVAGAGERELPVRDRATTTGETPARSARDHRYFRWRYSFTGKELGDMLRETLPKTLRRRPGVDRRGHRRRDRGLHSERAGETAVRHTNHEERVPRRRRQDPVGAHGRSEEEPDPPEHHVQASRRSWRTAAWLS